MQEVKIIEWLKDGMVGVQSESFFKDNITEAQKNKFNEELNSSRLLIRLYVLTWYLTYYHIFVVIKLLLNKILKTI
mgnify:CR=1 FL=1